MGRKMFASSSGINLSKNVLCDVKCSVCRRNSTIDGALQQDFLDFLACHFVIERRADVHAKFIAAVQSNHHGKRHKTTRVPGQAGAGPDLAPRVASDEVLKGLA